MLIVGVIGAIIVLLVAAGALYQALGTRRDLRRFPPLGQWFDVAGVRIHLHESGSGSPAVVLESGISATSISWALVQPEIAKFARVCSYDRAGLGWSDAAKAPRTPSQLARELRDLLAAAQIPAPYVLVGHSFGGLVIRAFAALYPSDVAGLVLVDPLRPEDWWPTSDQQKRMIARAVKLSRRGALLARVGVVRGCLALVMSGRRFIPKLAARVSSRRGGSAVTERLAGEIGKLPRHTWPMVAAHWSDPKSFEGMARHIETLSESVAEVAGRLIARGVPVTLITGANTPEAKQGWEPRLFGPEVKHVVAQQSGHWVQLDEPGLVIEAVRDVLARIGVTASRREVDLNSIRES